jgi:hypothetical protein
MKPRALLRTAVLLIAGLSLTVPLLAQDVAPERDDYDAPKKEYSPYVEDHFPNNVYFGDTHLHTSWSADSGMGGATIGPDGAYRVSRGESITTNSGWKVKLVRPLDFIVVADHSENLGISDFISRSDPIILANETGKRWHDLTKAGKGYEAFLEWVRSDKEDCLVESC